MAAALLLLFLFERQKSFLKSFLLFFLENLPLPLLLVYEEEESSLK